MSPKPDKSTKNFFISYTQMDRGWSEWIAWQLEAEGYSVVIQAWDFTAGKNFVEQMDNALKAAERTLLVLTPDALASRFVREEWTTALRQERLVPVRVRECDPEGLLGTRGYIDLVGLDEKTSRSRLLLRLSDDRAKPATAPAFPPMRPMRQRPAFPEEHNADAKLEDLESPVSTAGQDVADGHSPVNEIAPDEKGALEETTNRDGQRPQITEKHSLPQTIVALWHRPIMRRSIIAAILASYVIFVWYQISVSDRLEDSVIDSSEAFLRHVTDQDVAALTQMASTPFFFGERELSTSDAVSEHFTRIFTMSQIELGDETELQVGPAMFRGAVFSQWMANSARQLHFDIIDAAEIDTELDIYSADEREDPSGPEPTLDLKPEAARADIRVRGFNSEDVEFVYLYFSIRNNTPYFRGVLIR